MQNTIVSYEIFANALNFYQITVDDHIVAAVAFIEGDTTAVCAPNGAAVAYNGYNKEISVIIKCHTRKAHVQYRYIKSRNTFTIGEEGAQCIPGVGRNATLELPDGGESRIVKILFGTDPIPRDQLGNDYYI